MSKPSILSLILVLAAATAQPVQAAEQWFGTAMISLIDDDSDRGVDDSQAGYHLGLGRNLNYDWAAELNVVGGSFEDDGGSDALLQWGIGIDLRRRLAVSDYFLPYGLVGAGYLYSDNKLGRQDEDGLMLSLGAGVLSPLPWYDMSLRTELRVRNDYGDSTFTDYMLSVGVQVPFSFGSVIGGSGPGAGDAPMPGAGRKDGASDLDGDGVADSTDRCGGTPAGVVVDAYGCRVGQPEGMYAPGE